MDKVNIAIAAIGILVLVAGSLTSLLRHFWITGPMVAVLVGILAGPEALGWLDPEKWPSKHIIFEQTLRITLAISLMAVALRIPHGYLRQKWKLMLLLLIPVMFGMWLSSTILAWLVAGLTFWHALLLGAIITPTDPVLASSIVSGRFARENLPDDPRYLLSGESGVNDGLGYLFVFLPVLMLQHSTGYALYHWLVYVFLWEICTAVLVGFLMGYVAGRFVIWAHRHHITREGYILIYVTALALAVLGLTKLMGTDGILAVFLAGRGYVMAHDPQDKEKVWAEHMEEALNHIFLLPVFALFGMLIPWQALSHWGWTGAALVILVLVLRRLPWLLLVTPWMKPILHLPTTLFLGWFGPIGVSAMFYAMLAIRKADFTTGWHLAALIILVSVFAHGLTASPLTLVYRRREET